MSERHCPHRRSIGGVCVNLCMFGPNHMGCNLFPAPNLCLIEVEARESRGFLSRETKRKLKRCRDAGLCGPDKAVVVIPGRCRRQKEA